MPTFHNCDIYKLPNVVTTNMDDAPIKNVTLDSQHEVLKSVLRDLETAENSLLRYTLAEIVRRYVDTLDMTTQSIYLHYLMGKDFEESAHMLNIPESRVHRYFYTFISRFHRFTINQLKKGNIDIEETHCYIKCMQNQEMDDQEMAEAFKEDMLTTKVMKHFLKHANLILQFFVYTLSVADTLEIISLINFIHI